MSLVRVFQHAEGEGLGSLGGMLERAGFAFETVRPFAGDAVPEAPGDARALVVLGGPMSVNDPLPWIEPELAAIRAALSRGTPALGICLGAQLISRALGGAVIRNPVPEIGWGLVRKVDGPAARRWLDGLPHEFEVYHWHGEKFTIPEGAERFVESAACPNQGFVAGGALALQFHIEMTADMVRAWSKAVRADPPGRHSTVNTPAEMCARLDQRIVALNRIAEVVLGRWIDAIAR